MHIKVVFELPFLLLFYFKFFLALHYIYIHIGIYSLPHFCFIKTKENSIEGKMSCMTHTKYIFT